MTIQREKQDVMGPKIITLAKYSEGLTFEEALKKANNQNLVIASNKAITHALLDHERALKKATLDNDSKLEQLLLDEFVKGIKEAFPCWSGTMTGYVKQGQTLLEGSERIEKLDSHAIVYIDPETKNRWIFPIPEEYLNEKNAVLVAEHPDYTLEADGTDRIVKATKVDLVKDFATKERGWYLGDPKHNLPFGGPVIQDDATTEFYRVDKRVGPVVCYYEYVDFDFKCDSFLNGKPSAKLGVVVESSNNNEQH